MVKRLILLLVCGGLVGCSSDVGPNDPTMTKEDSQRRGEAAYTPEEAAARSARQR